MDVKIHANKLGMPISTLNTYIERSIADKTIISLKRNYYVTSHFFNKSKSSYEYTFFLSNILLSRSYVSRESALQYYGLMSESIGSYITSVTTKSTRKFKNRLGVFEYKSISEKLFFNFNSINFEVGDIRMSFLIANKVKSIFDYLYYREGKLKFSKSALLDLLDEYRIDYDSLSKSEINKLFNLLNDLS
jgi:predicted transcriptional regulator of viral defense system